MDNRNFCEDIDRTCFCGLDEIPSKEEMETPDYLHQAFVWFRYNVKLTLLVLYVRMAFELGLAYFMATFRIAYDELHRQIKRHFAAFFELAILLAGFFNINIGFIYMVKKYIAFWDLEKESGRVDAILFILFSSVFISTITFSLFEKLGTPTAIFLGLEYLPFCCLWHLASPIIQITHLFFMKDRDFIFSFEDTFLFVICFTYAYLILAILKVFITIWFYIFYFLLFSCRQNAFRDHATAT